MTDKQDDFDDWGSGPIGSHWLYAIGAMVSSHDVRAIKIGVTSSRVSWRLKQLQTGSFLPLRILGARPYMTRSESESEERRLHVMLKAERLRGEWFLPNRRVVQTVRDSRLGNHFVLDELDEMCWQYFDDPDSGHSFDEDLDGCPMGCHAEDWRAAI